MFSQPFEERLKRAIATGDPARVADLYRTAEDRYASAELGLTLQEARDAISLLETIDMLVEALEASDAASDNAGAARALKKLARHLDKLGCHSQALDALQQRVTRLRPLGNEQASQGLCELGRALIRQDRGQAALDAFEEASHLDPRALEKPAWAHQKMGQLEHWIAPVGPPAS